MGVAWVGMGVCLPIVYCVPEACVKKLEPMHAQNSTIECARDRVTTLPYLGPMQSSFLVSRPRPYVN